MRRGRKGEAALIDIISNVVRQRGIARVGIGDDACILKDGTVVSTDAYEQDVHFDLSYMTMREVGTRCTCAALSDVFAMGGKPQAVLVALAVPPDTNTAGIRALFAGIEHACARFGAEVTGGDIIASKRLLLALTVTGRARRPRLRSDGRPGQRLYITGWPGLAETGREVLRLGLSRRGYAAAARRHLEPWPRAEVVETLGTRIRALTDTSDGIATDATHLAEMSRVRVVLEPARLLPHPETRTLCGRSGYEPTEFALTSGEDYELLFTARGDIPERVGRVPVTQIGRIEKGSGVWVECSGRTDKLKLRGYDHLGR